MTACRHGCRGREDLHEGEYTSLYIPRKCNTYYSTGLFGHAEHDEQLERDSETTSSPQ